MLNLAEKRIALTGARGFLGQAVHAALRRRGVQPHNIYCPNRHVFDLTVESQVNDFYNACRPDVVIHLAAEVGGIGANMDHPGRFFYANMAMGLHLVEYARRWNVEKFVHVGTVCAYPKHCPVPFREDDLWNGYPEETNAPYGIAKKAIFVMLDGYRREYGLKSAVVVPVNLYGPGDNFDLHTSHVIPAMIRKFCEAEGDVVTLWGTGTATREFLYVHDAAEGVLRAAEAMDDPVPINLGGGDEVSIRTLAWSVADRCGYTGGIRWDISKPDGQPRRSLDVSRAKELLGWSAQTSLDCGLTETINWWRSNEVQRA